MRILGIAALSHDAAVAVIDDRVVRFAAQAERYSRRKNDPNLHEGLLEEALAFGTPEVIAWYERPLVKKVRHLVAGQYRQGLSPVDLPRRNLRRWGLGGLPVRFVPHHVAHAAGGALTSGFGDASILVADGIGEFATFSAYTFDIVAGLRRVASVRYPHSLGLLYSAFTRRCGLRPNEDEHILMGMAAYGRPAHVEAILNDLVEPADFGFRLKRNVHRGIRDWMPGAAPADLAASIQYVTEEIMVRTTAWMRRQLPSSNLVLGGGLALNCVANSRIAAEAGFDEVWILPNPGDAGSCIGAAAAVAGSPVVWPGPYLGTDIRGPYRLREIVQGLVGGHVVGVAHGRAEFGPRALGNRSLLADPRGPHVKERVNRVKGRELFRPFAPSILAELSDRYFEMARPESPYMQFVARCRSPAEFPAVVHRDGTSRVQTVRRDQNPHFYELLREFYRRTGCPMLLDTSLNVRGEPLVNSRHDARRFEAATGVPVF